MDVVERYLAVVQGQLEGALTGQREALGRAAGWVADALVGGHGLYAAGTGHSHLLALELFYRAGGLVRAVPMLDEDLMLHRSASRSSGHERETGRAAAMLERYGVGVGDVLLVVSNSGRNAVPVELALKGRERGARVVACTSLRHARAHGSRHASGKRLFEVADVVLDNAGVEGDAAVEVTPGLVMGATSTAVGAALVQALVLEAASRALERGWTPEVYLSSNGAGEAENARHLAKHVGRMPHL